MTRKIDGISRVTTRSSWEGVSTEKAEGKNLKGSDDLDFMYAFISVL